MVQRTQLRHRWWVVIAVGLATFMVALDNMVVNVALPSIQRELGVSVSALEWIVTGYILTFSALMLVGGRVADLYGYRKVFLGGVALFVLASVLAGLAVDEAMLVGGRLLQGCAAAMVTPTSLAIIGSAFPDPKERNTAVAWWTALTSVAYGLGPVVGGFVSQYLHWSWIFYANLPIGVVALGLGAMAIVESSNPAGTRNLDLPGLLVSCLALFALTFVLIEGNTLGWTSAPVLLAAGVSVVSFAAFVLIERRAVSPMLELGPFRNRIFLGGTVATIFWGLGFTGVLVYTSLFLQNVLGLSPGAAGAIFLAPGLLIVGLSPTASRLSERIGTNWTVGAGLALVALDLLAISFMDAHTATWQITVALGFLGFGTALVTPLTAAVLGALPKERAGVTAGVLNASRELSGLLGVTVLGVILVSRQRTALGAGADPGSAFMSGYSASLVIGAILVLLGALVGVLALGGAATRTVRPKDTVPVPARSAQG